MSPYVEPSPSAWSPGEPIWYDLIGNVILDASVTAPGSGQDAPNGTDANKALTGTRAAASPTPGAGTGNEKVSWHVQLQDKAMVVENSHQQQQKGPEWLEIQDLWVQRTESETLFTREGYLMVWERRKVGPSKGKETEKAS
jgi:U4/U6.U5 tri-snRNP-associated protein 2